MSPPASAIAWAILATIPLALRPVVVTTARLRPSPRCFCSAATAAATSLATIAARSPRPLATSAPARVATARVTRATSSRISASGSAGLTRQLHAIDDGHDRGVDGHVWLGPRGQHLRHRDPRRVPEGDDHVVAGAGVEHIGADHQIVER